MQSDRARFWIAATFGALSGCLSILTLCAGRWLELVTGVDLGDSFGSVEWAVVTLAAATSIALFTFARFEWLRNDRRAR